MPDNDYAWLRYTDLQERSEKAHYLNDYAWGIESALNYLLNAIETGTVPSNPAVIDAALNRAIASGARLRRSRSLALKKWVLPAESMSTNGAAEARIELARIGSAVSEADEKILLDTGLGYTDREIANRQASTPGAIRVRLSRLRHKLAAKRHSVTHPAAGREIASLIYGERRPDSQPVHRVA